MTLLHKHLRQTAHAAPADADEVITFCSGYYLSNRLNAYSGSSGSGVIDRRGHYKFLTSAYVHLKMRLLSEQRLVVPGIEHFVSFCLIRRHYAIKYLNQLLNEQLFFHHYRYP